MHTKNCGMAKREKCVCACKGARHQELIKKEAVESKVKESANPILEALVQ